MDIESESLLGLVGLLIFAISILGFLDDFLMLLLVDFPEVDIEVDFVEVVGSHRLVVILFVGGDHLLGWLLGLHINLMPKYHMI